MDLPRARCPRQVPSRELPAGADRALAALGGFLVPEPIDRFSLQFASPDLEAAFHREYREEALDTYRMLAIAVLGFLVAVSLTGLVVTFSVNRDGIQKLLWWALIPLTLVALAALYGKATSRRPRWVVAAYVAALGGVCVAYPHLQADRFVAETYGFSYPALLLFLALAFGRFPPPRGILLAASLIAAHAAVTGFQLGSAVAVSHVPMLLGASALGYSVGYLAERTARGLFAARAQVEERERRLAASERLLKAEQERSEGLIRSMLPDTIAARLKVEGQSIADGIAECTVLFADLVGFTSLARETGPKALVAVLNELFCGFDALCEASGVEKIKTIGDSYMAAAGVPDYVEDHPARAADLALSMLDAIARFNRDHLASLELRIGMHTGPVVAGIVGTHKFAYDLWGETVNTAARMESHGLPGRIQVSEATALLLKRTHLLEERGAVEVKGRGPMRTFWLTGRRAPASGIRPES